MMVEVFLKGLETDTVSNFISFQSFYAVNIFNCLWELQNEMFAKSLLVGSVIQYDDFNIP